MKTALKKSKLTSILDELFINDYNTKALVSDDVVREVLYLQFEIEENLTQFLEYMDEF